MSTIRVEGLPQLISKLNRIGGNAPQVMQLFLEKCGMDLLDVIQDQIIAMQVVDTRLMLNSFGRGDGGNIWTLSNGGLTLEIGTNVEYARFVNDGHWTTSSGVAKRWVPGHWSNGRFEYDPSAKSGMLLKRKFVRAQPYWDNAIAIYTTMFGNDFQQLVDHWLRSEWR